jgi:hypothetical protein
MQSYVSNEPIQKFIDTLLIFDIDTESAKKYQTKSEIVMAINTILNSRQYISERPNEVLKLRIVEKVERSVDANEPIHLIIAIGGFKNHFSITWPHIDWAEIFALKLLIDIALRIRTIYLPGITLEFTGDSHAMAFCNNLPLSSIDTYTAEFDNLLKIYQSYLPEGITLVQKHLSEFYDLDDLHHRMREQADTSLDTATLQNYEKLYLQKATNNFMRNGTHDYTNVSDEVLKSHLMRSVLLDRAWMSIDMTDRLEYLEGGNHIPIIHTSSPGSIMLKSVKTRKLAFWLGTGLLRITDMRVLPDIIHCAKFDTVPNLNYVRVESPFDTLPSLQSIPYSTSTWL